MKMRQGHHFNFNVKGEHRSGSGFHEIDKKNISLNTASTVLSGTVDFDTVANITFLVSPIENPVCPWQCY